MQAITFLIQLIDPLLATQPQSGEANSAVTYRFIPGSMLRGALIARYLGQAKVDAAEDGEFRQLFLDGTVRYLNAYMASPVGNKRMLPKPMSWYVRKDDRHIPGAQIDDFAIKQLQTDEPYKSPALGDFCFRSGADSVQLGNPGIRVTVHNASTKRNRKQEGDSQVFRYDALAPGGIFVGTIISEDEALLNRIMPLLAGGSLLLGRSQTAGYGRVEVHLMNDEPDPDWMEYTPWGIAEETLTYEEIDSEEDLEFEITLANQEDPDNDIVIVTLLSDVILPETSAQPEEWLKSLAGHAPINSFRRVVLVGGFNHKWGLPLPQRWALEMGSVFIFPLASKERLKDLIDEGIGERRAEGFGRIAVNWQQQPNLRQYELTRGGITVTAPVALSQTSQRLAQRMANRRLATELDRWLVREVNEQTRGKNAFRGLPSATQLSSARLAARRAWIRADLTEITSFFENMSPLSQREWADAKLNGTSLRHWIDQKIDKPEDDLSTFEMPVVASVVALLDPSTRDRTTARLIEGVLRRAVKKAQQDREGGDRERQSAMG